MRMDINRQKCYEYPLLLAIIANNRPFWRDTVEIDRFDARILSALQRDGRLSVVDLAELIGLSPTPCARRIKALESSGAIEGYAAILNPARVGLGVLAIVQVKLTEHTDETVAGFEREIQRMDEVTKCLAMTGSYDFILEVYGRDLDALSNVVLKKLIRVPNVRDMQSSVVLATVKRTARIPLGHLEASAPVRA
jgi:Lrp/AsnC family transcriptional regulator, leucine-responsive regulatory protein